MSLSLQQKTNLQFKKVVELVIVLLSFCKKLFSRIKRKPGTNLISHGKAFVFELFNPRSCCKPEHSEDEKSSFFICSTFFG